MICTRCDGTGFLNTHQLPDRFTDFNDWEVIYRWLTTNPEAMETDVCVCDCCGDGETWYGTPGEHYEDDDYPRNGGIPRCI